MDSMAPWVFSCVCVCVLEGLVSLRLIGIRWLPLLRRPAKISNITLIECPLPQQAWPRCPPPQCPRGAGVAVWGCVCVWGEWGGWGDDPKDPARGAGCHQAEPSLTPTSCFLLLMLGFVQPALSYRLPLSVLIRILNPHAHTNTHTTMKLIKIPLTH